MDESRNGPGGEDRAPTGGSPRHCEPPPVDRPSGSGPEADPAALLDRVTDAVVGLDRDWRLTYLNERARAAISEAIGRDCTVEQLRGQSLRELLPAVLDGPVGEAFREAIATQAVVSVEAYDESLGGLFEVRAYPSETGLSAYLRDVTDERCSREALATREAVLREVYEAFSRPDDAFDDRVEAVLEIGREVLGTRYGALSRIDDDRYTFEVVSAPDGDDSVRAGDVTDLGATNCERTVATEETLVLADVAREAPELTDRAGYTDWGISCYVGTPVTDGDGVYGTFCLYDTEPHREPFSNWEVTLVDLLGKWISYDLQRELAEERLVRQSDRLAEFATLVSHDLRNPLTVAQGHVELLDGEGGDGSDGGGGGEREHVAAVERALDRMEALIDDVLTLAREGRVVEEPTGLRLADVATDAWSAVPTDDARLRVRLDEEDAIRAESSRLRRLFENLFRNCVDHGGPDVTVTVGRVPGGFFVADDGSGIPPDRREAVLDPGVSTSDDGTGFGLAIVDEIAAAHGWSVAVVESDAGGVRFEFEGVTPA